MVLYVTLTPVIELLSAGFFFMEQPTEIRFSGRVMFFHERFLSRGVTPAGYGALIDAYKLKVPIPRTLSATSDHHQSTTERGWRILTARHAPAPTLEGHLTFALKYEGLDLAVLKRLFQATGPAQIEALIQHKPTGSYSRRIWFLYEWLLGQNLELPDVTQGAYVDAVDTEQQWAIEGINSPRQRVRNNMPGISGFCPLVYRTKALEEFIQMNLASRAQAVAAAVPRDLLARTAAFLLLNDSKSSYIIEGERPGQDRIQRWGRAIGEAGRHPISLDELLRLQ